MYLKHCVLLFGIFVSVRCKMEPFIVGGKYADITHFPHSAFLSVSCTIDGVKSAWICGSSILNQRLLLTAAHCLYSCDVNTHITIHVGNEHRDRGSAMSAHSFIIHEQYSSMTSDNDIAIVRIAKPIMFSKKVSRVAIMKKPPPITAAEIAGWGLNNEHNMVSSDWLMELQQLVWKRKDCLKRLKHLPEGSFCASSRKHDEYVAQGDSGSALVVRGYIQIGIVSYKVPAIARDVIVYADVAYYYNWIKFNSMRLYCNP